VTFFQAVAIDFDGTLTSRGEVSTKALTQLTRPGAVVLCWCWSPAASVRSCRASSRRSLTMSTRWCSKTGRWPRSMVGLACSARRWTLARRRAHGPGVPFRRGQVLVASDGEYAATVIEVIGQLGLDCQIIRNRAAVMVLPAG